MPYKAIAQSRARKGFSRATIVGNIADDVSRYEYTDEDGYRHWFRFTNGVPINKSHPDVLVNYLEYVEISPNGRAYA